MSGLRLLFLIPGAADMRCGACTRDVHLVFALRHLGHTVRVLPLYTPLRTDTDLGEDRTVHLGAIGISLRQALPFAAGLPAWATRPLAARALLGLLSRLGIETEAASLGPLTQAMLAGRDGPMRIEIEALCAAIRTHERYDAVHLGNSLLAGLAPALKERLGVPVVCAVQGEDEFLAALPEPWRGQVLDHLRRAAQVIDVFIAPSASVAAVMAPLLGIEVARIQVLRPGVPSAESPRQLSAGLLRLGYLSIIHPRKGLEVLAAAQVALSRRGIAPHLAIAGQVRKRNYWQTVRRELAASGAPWSYHGEPDGAGRTDFLRSCSMLALPTRSAEARAMVALESLAEGVPVLLSRRGVCPEIVALTGGGLIVETDDPEEWAEVIAGLMADAPRLATLGQAGWEGVRKYFSPETMARGMVEMVGTGGDR